LKPAVAAARQVAFEILLRVARGGHAADLLRTRTLDARDAALASEIILGSLRYQAQLDFLIQRGSGRAPQRLDGEVLTALRMGLYQLRWLDRIPAHAAVGESVELVKRAGKRSAAGLVNAVLRKADREPVEWPDRATALSAPAWMLESWERQFGAEVAGGIARTFLVPPEVYVGSTGRIQDIGAQSIVPLLELQAGESFLDLCAAPGNKTAQALECGVWAVACDIDRERLRPLRELGCPLVELDGAEALPFAARFDAILVDAPCSGTGTLGRNPEIKWRVQSSDLGRFQARQVRLLRNALGCLKPGGRLVYATCSLEREENEDVVAQVVAPARVAKSARRIPGVVAGDGFFAAVITSN
jgi:16S rRNA (cytosine967-C5)-methyltransferase